VTRLVHYTYYAYLTFKSMIRFGYNFRQFCVQIVPMILNLSLFLETAKGFSSTLPSLPLPFPSGVNRCLCDPVYFEVSVNLSIAEFCETLVAPVNPGLPHSTNFPFKAFESTFLLLAISSRYLFQSENDNFGEFF